MAITDAIIRYRRFLKRRNVSPNTVKNYLNGLKHFVLWLDVPIEEATYRKIIAYMDYLARQTVKAKDDQLLSQQRMSVLSLPLGRRGSPDRQPGEEAEYHEAPQGTSQASERRADRDPLQESERAKGSSHVHDYAPMRITGGRSGPSFPRQH